MLCEGLDLIFISQVLCFERDDEFRDRLSHYWSDISPLLRAATYVSECTHFFPTIT